MPVKTKKLDPAAVPEWMWELNGAGDPGALWIDHVKSDTKERAAHRIDAGFLSGTWAVRLNLPDDLDEVSEEMHPAFIVMGLADTAIRLEEKLREAVRLCRDRGLPWETIGQALGVTRQAAWRRFATPTDG